MSILALLMLADAQDSAGTVSLTNRDAYQARIEGLGTATATYSLDSTGVVSATGEASGFWIDPQVGMDLFEVRATLNSGSLTSGTTGSWLSLGTTRSWTNTASAVPGFTANLTIEIRRIGEVSILATATVTVTAEILSS